MKTRNETLLNQKINFPVNKKEQPPHPKKQNKKNTELLFSAQNNRVNIYK